MPVEDSFSGTAPIVEAVLKHQVHGGVLLIMLQTAVPAATAQLTLRCCAG